MSLPPFVWLILWLILSAPFVYIIGRIDILMRTRRNLAHWLSLLCIVVGWGALGRMIIDFYGLGGLESRTSPDMISQATWRLGLVTMRFDGLSLLLTALVLTLTTAILLFSKSYIGRSDGAEKHYALLLLLCGAIVGLGSAGDLFNLWVWFEAMAIASLPLIVYYRHERTSLEAGVKYLIQSSTGSVFILLGIALVLLSAGSLDILAIQETLNNISGGTSIWLTAGVLFIIGYGIKVALVPLHTWLPDAHAQAPSGISAILSAVVIQSGLIALLRALSSLTGAAATWGIILIGLGVLNMLLGNLLALRQRQVKRLLAFSSISHVGYMVVGLGVALFVGTAAGAQAGFFHLLSHGLMKGLAFLAVGALMYAFQQGIIADGSDGDHQSLTIDDMNGAARHYPVIALALSLALLGLGGLPPLVGFMSKWQIMFSGAQAQEGALFLVLIIIALSSVLSLAYYTPIVNAMYRQKPAVAVTRGRSIPLSMTAPLVILAVAIVILGILPVLAGWLTLPAAIDFLSAFGL
jgi:proton-translocating NADH-quinone oxidoreductase chain N